MRQLDDRLWVHEDDQNPMLRMTIVELRSGDLWVHSPTPLSAEVKATTDSLGSVSAIVAPNNHHHQSLLEWARAYPHAEVFVARGIPAKLPELADYQVLGDEQSATKWADDLDIAVMQGVPLFDECVFFHRSSHSLIVTDLVQNYSGSRPEGLLYKLIFSPLGYKGIILAPPLRFDSEVNDRGALNTFIEKVKGWPFERIIVTHGDVIDVNATAVFSDICAYRFEVEGGLLNTLALKLFIRLTGN